MVHFCFHFEEKKYRRIAPAVVKKYDSFGRPNTFNAVIQEMPNNIFQPFQAAQSAYSFAFFNTH
jgi:hypothetical protein